MGVNFDHFSKLVTVLDIGGLLIALRGRYFPFAIFVYNDQRNSDQKCR
ncbi:hypothetical protein AT1219_100006 [Vibrio alginolyticus]